MYRLVEDKGYLLSTPLHGVFIPAGLLIVGIAIVKINWLPYGILLAFTLAVLKFYRGQPSKSLDPIKFQEFELQNVTAITHDTNLYRFAFLKPNDTFNLNVGQSIEVGTDNYSNFYTPVSTNINKGFFELLIKTKENGKMSKYLPTMGLHQVIQARGPVGGFSYKENKYNKLAMIAGGTGVTPMLQIIDAIVKNPNDTTDMFLLFANKTADDILLKEDLDELAEKYPNFIVHYKLESESGFINKSDIEKYIPKDYNVVICGPPDMNTAVKNYAESMNRTVSFVFE